MKWQDPYPGGPVEYDVLDDLGAIYILHGNQGEIVVKPFDKDRTIAIYKEEQIRGRDDI